MCGYAPLLGSHSRGGVGCRMYVGSPRTSICPHRPLASLRPVMKCGGPTEQRMLNLSCRGDGEVRVHPGTPTPAALAGRGAVSTTPRPLMLFLLLLAYPGCTSSSWGCA